jgi:hypothetical protein
MQLLKMIIATVSIVFGMHAMAGAPSLKTESRAASAQTIAGMSQPDARSMIQTAEKSGVHIRDVVAFSGSGKEVLEQSRSYGCSMGCSSGCSYGCSSGCSVGCSVGCR